MPEHVMDQLRTIDTKELMGKDMKTFCELLIEKEIFQDESAIQLFVLDFLVKAIHDYGVDLPITYVEELKK